MILRRHVTREVGRPLIIVVAVLLAVFAAYSMAAQLAGVASGLLPIKTVALLVLLKTFIAIEVLLPIALYLTLILGLGRMNAHQELTAMLACGFGRGRVARSLLPLLLLIAVVVGMTSAFGRPRAYALSYQLRARAEASFSFEDLKSGRFYELGDGDRVIFVDEIEPTTLRMRGILAWIDRGRSSILVSVGEAYGEMGDGGRPPVLEARDVRIYELIPDRSALRLSVESLVTDLTFEQVAPFGYKRKAAPTAHLLQSNDSEDVAEMQWRLSRGLSVLVLGWLGFRFGWIRPLRLSFARFALPILTFIAYFLASTAARNGVEARILGAWPGVWLVDAGAAAILSVISIFERFAGRSRLG